jgi:hypothetical protein
MPVGPVNSLLDKRPHLRVEAYLIALDLCMGSVDRLPCIQLFNLLLVSALTLRVQCCVEQLLQ